MSEYTISTEEQIIDDKSVTVYSVVDSDGYPINYGHFTEQSDAEYVRDEMETGEYRGDRVSDLSKEMRSWVEV